MGIHYATILRIGGFEFFFFAGDHEPAHVHVRNGDGVAIIDIDTATVRHTLGSIRKWDVARAKSLVHRHRYLLQAAWDEFHGRRR